MKYITPIDLAKAAVIGDVELALYRSEQRIADPDHAFKDGNGSGWRGTGR